MTGVAGSGKSFLLKCLFPKLVEYFGFSTVFPTATTNVAASNIGGITLARFLGLSVNYETTLMINMKVDNPGRPRAIKQHIEKLQRTNAIVLQNITICKVIIVDEAGMLDLPLFLFMDAFLRTVKDCKEPFGGVRIILIGDILQLPPVADKRYVNSGKFFFDDVIFEVNFFIAYLRENHRQKNSEFLEILNKVRVGDPTALTYLNDKFIDKSATSRSTLTLALKKTCYCWSLGNENLNLRIGLNFIQKDKVNPQSSFWTNFSKTRIDSAEEKGFIDLIICAEHAEISCYTTERLRNMATFECQAIDETNTNRLANSEVYKNIFSSIDTKMSDNLQIYIGMSCRITYKTDNQYICANTLVIIENIIRESNEVKSIAVYLSTNNKIKTVLTRITISETLDCHIGSRTQFSIVSSVGLLPWALQCLTMSCNIFYDNSRVSKQQGFLYTIMSRVKSEDQLGFLHRITEEDIKLGVNPVALRFDDRYRLKAGVIFELKERL